MSKFKIEKVEKLKKKNLKKIRKILKKANIDPKILELVIGLRVWGINTTASCQGGKGHGKNFPWVTVQWKDLGKVARIVFEWNYRQKKSLHDPKTVI